MFARHSGAENGFANFMGAWNSMPTKILVLEGGIWILGLEVPILFLWAWGFS